MKITSQPVDPGNTMWCDYSGFPVEGIAKGWFIGDSEHPISRTSPDVDEEQEEERLTIWMTLRLDSSGDDLYKVSDEHWSEMVGTAAYVYDGYEEGMLEHSDAFHHHSFIAYGTREWPKTIKDSDGDLFELLTVYQLSPEISCPWCGDGTGNEDSRSECKLCEGDSYIAIGEYWQVAVYGYVDEDEE